MGRRGKAIAIASVAFGLVVLVGAGIASKDRILEEWWIYKLKTGDEHEKETAAGVLGEMKSIRAIPLLADLLRAEIRELALLVEFNGKHRYLKIHYVANALEKIGAPAVPALAGCLGHPNPLVRVQAANVLCRMGPEASGLLFVKAKALLEGDQIRAGISKQIDLGKPR